MIFLIEYDRSKGRLIKLSPFDESDRQNAEDRRLELELSLKSKGIDREVVLLDAASEDALRLTHRRYFEDIRGLTKPRRAAQHK
jgi:hypothetical protein